MSELVLVIALVFSAGVVIRAAFRMSQLEKDIRAVAAATDQPSAEDEGQPPKGKAL